MTSDTNVRITVPTPDGDMPAQLWRPSGGSGPGAATSSGGRQFLAGHLTPAGSH